MSQKRIPREKLTCQKRGGGGGGGGGGVEKHRILSIFHSMLLSIFYSIDLVTNTAAILN